MSNLRSKTVKGIAVLGAGKSLGKLISFANTLILARILSPDDYGLMAMAMVVAGFVGFFNEIGLGSAIIQQKKVTEEQLSGSFYIALITCSLLYTLTYLFSPFVASFYGNDEVEVILQLLGLSFFLGAVKTVPDALLIKQMKFTYISAVEFLGVLIVCSVTLVLAYMDFKTLSLVYGYLAGELFKAITILFISQWRPTLNGSIREAMGLMRFGLTVTYSRLTWYLYSNASTLILGRFVGSTQTGIWGMAVTIASLPTANITNLIIQVASPLFSKLQNDYQALNNALLKLTVGISLITFPVLVGIILTADELIPVLLGEQWLAVVIPMKLLCVRELFKSIDPLLTQAFISIGKANITAKYTSVCAIFIPFSIFIGAYYYGVNGAAVALALVYPFLAVYLLILAKKHYQLPVKKYLRQLLTPISACVAMAAVILVFDLLFMPLLTLPVLGILLLKILLGVLSYVIWIIYINTDGIRLLKSVLQDIGISNDKLARWPFNQVKDV
jgi:O-antigen/teichoic acid export membrane protein